MDGSHPKTWLITENNVTTNTGEEGLRETRTMFMDWLLKTEEGNISYKELKMSTQDRSRWSQLRCKPAIWQNTADIFHVWIVCAYFDWFDFLSLVSFSLGSVPKGRLQALISACSLTLCHLFQVLIIHPLSLLIIQSSMVFHFASFLISFILPPRISFRNVSPRIMCPVLLLTSYWMKNKGNLMSTVHTK